MYHYNITYSNIAWKNMVFFTDAATDSEALAKLIEYEGGPDHIRIKNIETIEIKNAEEKNNEH